MESITLIGGIFITSTSIITVIWYIFVLIAEYISIVEAESFILLTSQSICDICSLLQYVLLGIEILIGNEVNYFIYILLFCRIILELFF